LKGNIRPKRKAAWQRFCSLLATKPSHASQRYCNASIGTVQRICPRHTRLRALDDAARAAFAGHHAGTGNTASHDATTSSQVHRPIIGQPPFGQRTVRDVPSFGAVLADGLAATTDSGGLVKYHCRLEMALAARLGSGRRTVASRSTKKCIRSASWPITKYINGLQSGWRNYCPHTGKSVDHPDRCRVSHHLVQADRPTGLVLDRADSQSRICLSENKGRMGAGQSAVCGCQ
jgi:hypothetical protein